MLPDRTIQPWDSDHTALVHVLWAARDKGLFPTNVNSDRLAAHIMQSKWMKAVRLHAVQRASDERQASDAS